MKEFIKSSWWLIINAGYLLLILLISFVAFTVPEQTQDFIYVFLQDFEITYIIAVYGTLLFWCFVTWYSACIVLQIDPVKGSLDRMNSEAHVNRTLYIPKIIGIIPCIILLFAINNVNSGDQKYPYRGLHIGLILGSLLFSLLIFFLIDRKSSIIENVGLTTPNRNVEANPYNIPTRLIPFLKHLIQVTPVGNWPSLKEVDIFKAHTNQDPTLGQELVFIAQFTGVRFFFIVLGAICLLITLLMCVPEINLLLSSKLRPGAILILSLASFTLLFTIIAYFHDYTRRPFGVIVLIIVIIFSYWNDNTELEYLKNSKAGRRQPVNIIFHRWLIIKKKEWQSKHPGTKMPIVFIATQGGGIRGLSWTTRVFDYLETNYPDFLNQTFVISGVSGGGVGAMTYLSWKHDHLKFPNDTSTYKALDSFTKRDFLSPVTSSFAFSDNLQRFLPFPVSSFDRSKMLGRTWDLFYGECVGHKTFSSSFLEIWYPKEGVNYNLPSLILNGTLAENGQRVVTSNLDLDKSEWFKDDLDFFAFSRRDISRSTAALNCSRFPFITSGGLLENSNTSKGHVVDGGYRENTGLQTLLNVYSSIRDSIRNDQDVKVLVLYLQNGKDELNDTEPALRVMQDVLVPVVGLVKVNGTGLPAKSIVQFNNQIFSDTSCVKVKFMALQLENREETEINLPLGWYMSDIVSNEIAKRVQEIPIMDKQQVNILNHWFPK